MTDDTTPVPQVTARRRYAVLGAGHRAGVSVWALRARERAIPGATGGHGGSDVVLVRDVLTGSSHDDLLVRATDHLDGIRVPTGG